MLERLKGEIRSLCVYFLAAKKETHIIMTLGLIQKGIKGYWLNKGQFHGFFFFISCKTNSWQTKNYLFVCYLSVIIWMLEVFPRMLSGWSKRPIYFTISTDLRKSFKVSIMFDKPLSLSIYTFPKVSICLSSFMYVFEDVTFIVCFGIGLWWKIYSVRDLLWVERHWHWTEQILKLSLF